jgi:phosphopantothenate synthetase
VARRVIKLKNNYKAIKHNIISVNGNVITVDFAAKTDRLDPSKLLNADELEIFYQTVREIEQYDKLEDHEWNMIIELIQHLSRTTNVYLEKAISSNMH